MDSVGVVTQKKKTLLYVFTPCGRQFVRLHVTLHPQ